MRHTSLIPFILAAITLATFEILFKNARLISWILALSPIVIFGAIYAILGHRLKTPSARLKFLIAPTLLIWSSLSLVLFLEQGILRHLLAIIVSLFMAFFFESLATYIWHHHEYETFSLENISGYALTLTTFAGSASLLSASAWSILSMALILFLLVNYKMMWISKAIDKHGRMFLIILTLAEIELFGILKILPLHFLAGGALLTVTWYTGIVIVRAKLLGLLTSKVLKRHLMLGGALTALLLLVTRWI